MIHYITRQGQGWWGDAESGIYLRSGDLIFVLKMWVDQFIEDRHMKYRHGIEFLDVRGRHYKTHYESFSPGFALVGSYLTERSDCVVLCYIRGIWSVGTLA